MAVKRRVDAFNRHDLEAYLSAHDPAVRIYQYPDTLLGEGRDHLRRVFAPTFERRAGQMKIVGQFVINDTVVSSERLTLNGRSEHLIAIYSVVDGRLATIRLIEQPDRRS